MEFLETSTGHKLVSDIQDTDFFDTLENKSKYAFARFQDDVEEQTIDYAKYGVCGKNLTNKRSRIEKIMKEFELLNSKSTGIYISIKDAERIAELSDELLDGKKTSNRTCIILFCAQYYIFKHYKTLYQKDEWLKYFANINIKSQAYTWASQLVSDHFSFNMTLVDMWSGLLFTEFKTCLLKSKYIRMLISLVMLFNRTYPKFQIHKPSTQVKIIMYMFLELLVYLSNNRKNDMSIFYDMYGNDNYVYIEKNIGSIWSGHLSKMKSEKKIKEAYKYELRKIINKSSISIMKKLNEFDIFLPLEQLEKLM